MCVCVCSYVFSEDSTIHKICKLMGKWKVTETACFRSSGISKGTKHTQNSHLRWSMASTPRHGRFTLKQCNCGKGFHLD